MGQQMCENDANLDKSARSPHLYSGWEILFVSMLVSAGSVKVLPIRLTLISNVANVTKSWNLRLSSVSTLLSLKDRSSLCYDCKCNKQTSKYK